MAKVFKIAPTTQKYDWGKIGTSSKVAQFASASQLPGFTIDEGSPYAELWMGTHPTSPSRVRSSDELLSNYLASHPNLIGADVIEKFNASGGNLPFLFKVLSIEKALSIQTHPDKKMAEELHAQHPHIYKDPNHKPELAIAITPFRALCGFRPLPEIATYLNSTPELRALISPKFTNNFISLSHSSSPAGPEEKSALKDLFASLMTADQDAYKNQLTALIARYQSGSRNEGEDDGLVELILKLNSQFPGDIGIFCPFVLNYVHMNPGDAIFLGAGEPHAYISGECIECMANSDNVIRAGLTPKLRDVPNLVRGLTYTASPPSKHVVVPTPFQSASSAASKLYDPPIPEFSVVQVTLPPGQRESHKKLGGPSVGIAIAGGGVVRWENEKLSIGLGDVFVVGADTQVEFEAKGDNELIIYRAFVESTLSV